MLLSSRYREKWRYSDNLRQWTSNDPKKKKKKKIIEKLIRLHDEGTATTQRESESIHEIAMKLYDREWNVSSCWL